MQRINRVLALALILLIIFLLPGCQQSPEGAIDENGAQETIIVEDCLGRKVEVPKNVERIAALYSFAGYAVGLLGRGDKDGLFAMTFEEIEKQGGHGGHELLNWMAVMGAMGGAPARVLGYEPVIEWICGMGYLVYDF